MANNKANSLPELKVFSIHKVWEKSGKAKVGVSYEFFKLINKFEPDLQYTTAKAIIDGKEGGIRKYVYNGIEFFTSYDKEENKNHVYMDLSDAQALFVEKEAKEEEVVIL